MRRTAKVALVCAALVVAATTTPQADECIMSAAQVTAMKMIDAHGGLDKWRSAPTMSFKQTMIAPQEPTDPWTSIEMTHQSSRRTYQDWPLDKATITSDGKKTWSEGWKRGNPPKFMVNLAYYFINLPWLTMDDGVVLEGPGEGKLLDDDKTYITLRMTFEAGVGDASDDYYVIFIDPDTYMMRGVEFIVTYGAMLDLFGMPEDVKQMGPLFKVFDDYKTVEGLKVSTRYKTFTPDGTLYGDHTVEQISFSKPFDEARMTMPEGALIDQSSNERKKIAN